MKFLKLGVLVLALSGCTTVQESTRLTTELEAKEYNSLYAQYLNRPTFTSIEKMSDGSTVLVISRDDYGLSTSPLRFSKKNVSKYTSLIDKYFEWNKLASSRGDAITKDIGKADTWGNSISGSLKFTFHSGNSANHYLSISFCAAGTCLDEQALYFDPKNTLELKKLLVQLKTNEDRVEDLDQIYR